MGHEMERTRFADAVDRIALPLLSEVARLAQRFGPSPDAVARRHFSFWHGALDEDRAARIIDFLMFDIRLEGYGRRAIDQFIVEQSARRTPAELQMLDAWSTSTFRLYAVTRWSGGFVTCKDALAEDGPPIEVLPLRGREPIPQGRALALRALACADGYFCTGRLLQFNSSVDGVAAAIRLRHLDHVRRERIVSFDDFLRAQPTVFDEEAAGGATSALIVPGGLR